MGVLFVLKIQRSGAVSRTVGRCIVFLAAEPEHCNFWGFFIYLYLFILHWATAMSQPAEDQEGGSGCLQEDRLLRAHSVPLSITSGNAGCQGTGLRLEYVRFLLDPFMVNLGPSQLC